MTAYRKLPGVCVACGQWTDDRPRHTVVCLPMAVALDKDYWPFVNENLARTQAANGANGRRGGKVVPLAVNRKGEKLCRCGRGPIKFRNYCRECHNAYNRERRQMQRQLAVDSGR